jgi:acetyltransferase-like isoleucine patch superfamily enzyme
MILRMKVVRRLDWHWHVLTGRVGARFQGIAAPRSARFVGAPVVDIAPGSTISIGERVSIYSKARLHVNAGSFPSTLSTRDAAATISIGDDSALASTVLNARADITIGERVMIGPDCRIYAGKIHTTDEIDRRYLPPDPRDEKNSIVVEDDVFIGAWVMVMAGVTIGRGSVIGAHSVVTRDIPPFSVAAGSPARVIRTIVPRKADADRAP